MKFRSPHLPRLHVYGAGRFVDGVLETDDPAAIARVRHVAARHGIQETDDQTGIGQGDGVEPDGGEPDGTPPSGDED